MTDFIKAQFGVEATRLTYENVVDFFSTAKVENTNLEFKSFNGVQKLPEKIYNSICALLNSNGGLIIWGSPKESFLTDGLKQCFGDLTPLKEKLKKEDLMRSISDKITPIPNNIEVYEIDDKNGSYIYLFQIQRSEYSPHQTDNRYYMRLDAETRIAPHYFVEALFRKVKYPDLKGSIEFMNITFMDSDYQYVMILIKVIVRNNSPLQNEEYPQFTVSCSVGIPLESYEPWPPKVQIIGTVARSQINPMEILYYGNQLEKTYKIGLLSDDLNRLKSNDARLNISLKFGGRYSPLKLSNYSIDTSFFTRLEYGDSQSYSIPVERIDSIENKLVADSNFDLNLISNWKTITR
jgi:hypothetical protein